MRNIIYFGDNCLLVEFLVCLEETITYDCKHGPNVLTRGPTHHAINGGRPCESHDYLRHSYDGIPHNPVVYFPTMNSGSYRTCSSTTSDHRIVLSCFVVFPAMVLRVLWVD